MPCGYEEQKMVKVILLCILEFSRVVFGCASCLF